MAIEPEKFIMTDSKYKSGLALDEYGGKVAIVTAREAKDGNIYVEWAYPQKYVDGEKVPHTKSLPWKIQLGSSRKEALNVLREIAAMLKGPEEPTPERNAEDEIPF